jgi:hypothetical protein
MPFRVFRREEEQELELAPQQVQPELLMQLTGPGPPRLSGPGLPQAPESAWNLPSGHRPTLPGS